MNAVSSKASKPKKPRLTIGAGRQCLADDSSQVKARMFNHSPSMLVLDGERIASSYRDCADSVVRGAVTPAPCPNVLPRRCEYPSRCLEAARPSLSFFRASSESIPSYRSSRLLESEFCLTASPQDCRRAQQSPFRRTSSVRSWKEQSLINLSFLTKADYWEHQEFPIMAEVSSHWDVAGINRRKYSMGIRDLKPEEVQALRK